MTKLHIVRLRGDTETYPISIQLWLDSEGRSVPRGTTFGVVGDLSPKSDAIYPFVLFADGTIDCGTGFEGTDGRYGKANFYDNNRVVEVDELFTINWDEDGTRARTYRVVLVTPISG